MSYKMIVLDLDHTLLKEDGTISSVNRTMLQRCIKNGLFVTLATGRMLSSARPYAESLALTLPIITCQGAMISSLNHEILYQRTLDNAIAKDLLAILKTFPVDAICCHNQSVYATSARTDFVHKDTLPTLGHHHLPLPDDIGDIAPLKIGASGEATIIAQLCQQICKTYGAQTHAVQSSPFFLEITHPEATKSNAVDYLAKKFHISPTEIIAVGDSMNDLDLVRYAGCGVAVQNAATAILDAADYITDTNENDGVAKALAHLLFTT